LYARGSAQFSTQSFANKAAAELVPRQRALMRLEEDIDSLARGELTRLHPGGVDDSLLLGLCRGVTSEGLCRRIVRMYTMCEFSAQMARRLGQMSHLGGWAAHCLRSAARSRLRLWERRRGRMPPSSSPRRGLGRKWPA
jgi:hypothetical protein